MRLLLICSRCLARMGRVIGLLLIRLSYDSQTAITFGVVEAKQHVNKKCSPSHQMCRLTCQLLRL